MTLSKCAQPLAVTSACTYLPAFFLLFDHFLNDLKFPETCSYPLLSLKCQQLSLLPTTCPFLSPASPELWLLLYPTSNSGNPCPPHPSIPALPLPALFLVPQTWGVSLLPSGECQAGPLQCPCSSPSPPGCLLWHKIIPWHLPKPWSPNPALRDGICARHCIGRTLLMEGQERHVPYLSASHKHAQIIIYFTELMVC